MSTSIPSMEPAPADRTRGDVHRTRRGLRELARIYLAASAPESALETLSRLGEQSWDEETILLRAESLLGLGRVPEAEELLGPVMMPMGSEVAPDQQAGSGSIRAHWPGGAIKRTGTRRDRLALWRFLLQLRVLHRTGRYRYVLGLGRAFFSSRQSTPSVLVARIATVVAQSMLALRQPAEARSLYEDVLELYKDLRSPEGVADTLLGLANTQLLDCHWDEADALYQEARFRYEEMGQTDKALACQVNLGVLRVKRGDLAGGRALLLQALARCAQVGDERRASTARLGLALAEIRAGDFAGARGLLVAALRRARRVHSLRDRALACEFLGQMFLHQRRFRRARIALAAGLVVAREIAPEGDVYFEIRRLQAELALAERRLHEARSLASEAQALALAYGDTYEVALGDRVLAEADAAEGQVDVALERIQGARQVLGRLGETYERARLELVALRLEMRRDGLAVGRVRARLDEACRPFHDLPDAPILREARRLLAGSGRNAAGTARSLGASRTTRRRSLQDVIPARREMES
jgi:tetratricopeptide (TPR) repeat protein